jgi:hypothetical protein
MQSIYLRHDPSLKVHDDFMQAARYDTAIQLEIQDGLKLFETVPRSFWHPAHSLLYGSRDAAALVLDLSSSPYGSTIVLFLNGRIRGTMYALPSSSPAAPYIFKNILSLSKETLNYTGI